MVGPTRICKISYCKKSEQAPVCLPSKPEKGAKWAGSKTIWAGGAVPDRSLGVRSPGNACNPPNRSGGGGALATFKEEGCPGTVLASVDPAVASKEIARGGRARAREGSPTVEANPRALLGYRCAAGAESWETGEALLPGPFLQIAGSLWPPSTPCQGLEWGARRVKPGNPRIFRMPPKTSYPA